MGLGPGVAWGQADCGEWVAEFVAVEGNVEIQLDNGSWRAVERGDTACRGDSVRTNEFSGAAVRLPDRSELRLDQNTQMRLPMPADEPRNWVEVLKGIILIISRDPRSLRLDTPYANAGLEGTEFVIEVSDNSTEVTVIEGEVVLTNGSARVNVASGQSATATAAAAPVTVNVDDPFDRVRWAPYYLRLSASSPVAPDAIPTATERADPNFYVSRAQSRLRTGALAAVEDDIATALALDPDAASPHALRAVIALQQGDKDEAQIQARRALEAQDGSVEGLLALSYIQEARFEIDAAAATLEQAATVAPDDALVNARISELSLKRGRVDAGEAAARRAIDLEPALGLAHTMLGFAALMRADTSQAIASFTRATELDQGAPLPHVGLGFALARARRLEEARNELEVAVALDPGNANIRSQMAKLYGESGGDDLVEPQLSLAATLDPEDPTSLLYRAQYAQLDNRPIDALQAIDAATVLNAGRLSSRSQFRLDEDAGVRAAGLSRPYLDLGMQNLALPAAWLTTASDRVDPDGHRMLSSLYAAEPQHEIAREYEAFQLLLTQRPNGAPYPAPRSELPLFIRGLAGPSELDYLPYMSLIDRDGVRLRGSAVSASRSTRSYDVELAGRNGAIGYGFGLFDYASDGIRPNNDMEHQLGNLYVQYSPVPDLNLIAEYRNSTVDKGTLDLLRDPTDFSPDLRQSEDVDSFRMGMRKSLLRGGTLLGAIVLEDAGAVTGSSAFALDTTRAGGSVELLYNQRFGRIQLTSGIYRLRQSEDTLTMLNQPSPFPPFPPTQDTIEQTVGYAYADVSIGKKFDTTFGVNVSHLDSPTTKADQTNPKLGFMFRPTARTTLRAALLRTQQGPIVSRQSIMPRLEPTHVSSFDQFYTGVEGEDAWRAGVGIDHRISDRLFIGLESSRRDIELKSVVELPNLPPFLDTTTRDEELSRAYLYWIPDTQFGVSVSYQDEEAVVDGQSSTSYFTQIHTRRLPVELSYFSSGRLRAGAQLTFVDQSGEFTSSPFGSMISPYSGSDSFRVLDLSLEYRLPNRRGAISLVVKNASDEKFLFQDRDPANPSIVAERLVALRFTAVR